MTGQNRSSAVMQQRSEPHKNVAMADIREEAVQTAAMALRWIASIDRYDFTPGKQHEQPMQAWEPNHDADA